MKSLATSIMLAILLSVSGCSTYALVDPLPPLPSPTSIAVATLPPTATPTLSAPLPAAAQPEPIFQPTETPLPEPTATFTPEPDWLSHAGRTEEGLMFLGNPEAPVTMIDFSDFM